MVTGLVTILALEIHSLSADAHMNVKIASGLLQGRAHIAVFDGIASPAKEMAVHAAGGPAWPAHALSNFYQIHPFFGFLAVILAVVLSMVTTRVAGETDIAPLGAMGKMTQFFYAAVTPGQAVTNLMSANVTAGSASHTADLLTDLKSGYILGAKPRQQFFAQFFGVCAGTLACVPAYNLLVPNAEVLGTKFAAPAALIWKATAEALSFGLKAIPPTALYLAGFTIAFGVAVTLLEHFVPKTRKFLPSPTGLGLGLVLTFGQSLSIFLGALAAFFVYKFASKKTAEYVIPVSSGIIAGESIISVLIIAAFVLLGVV